MKPIETYEGVSESDWMKARNEEHTQGWLWVRAVRSLWHNGRTNTAYPVLTPEAEAEYEARNKVYNDHKNPDRKTWDQGARPADWDFEESDLLAPWTPDLLVAISLVSRVAEQYDAWTKIGDVQTHRWFRDTEINLPHLAALASGEKVFARAIEMFTEAGLDKHTCTTTSWATGAEVVTTEPYSFVEYVEEKREVYRKRVAWMSADMKWVPFQMDSNSLGFYPDINSPDVWQVIVDKARDEEGERWAEFLGNMKMASVAYLTGEDRPEHHPAIPASYGISTKKPSFGYRREHRSDTVLHIWAKAVGLDLLNPEVW
jgi:hypothetical protein